jgi:acyl-CoA thioester hydrolase
VSATVSAGGLAADLRERASFSARVTVDLRFNDTDLNGHVNNSVFATMLESGRVALLYDTAGCVAGPQYGFSLARLTIDFLAEMRYPGTADIGTRIERLGRTSLTLGQGVFHNGVCAAIAETVVVMLDLATRRPAPLNDAVRARLLPHTRAG